MSDREIGRAAERVTLACRALAAAADDLRAAYGRRQIAPVDDAASMLEEATGHVCELSTQLASLAVNVDDSRALRAPAAPANVHV